MADEDREKKTARLGSFLFVGCLIIAVGVGIGFNLMPSAIIIGLGAGFIAMGIAHAIKLANGNCCAINSGTVTLAVYVRRIQASQGYMIII